MNESHYLGLIVILFGLLAVMIPAVTYVFIKKIRIFKRVLFIYILISMSIVAVFTVIYMTVFVLDLQNFRHQYPHGFAALNISNEKKQEILNSFLHFKGINFLDYNGNVKMLLLDLFYFSSMTFFTVGYGDITVSGIVRIIPIVESVLGVAMTGITISMILSNSIEMSKKEDTLRMFIVRGYDILCFQKISIKDLRFLSIFSKRKNEDVYHVHLLDSNNKVATIYYIWLPYEAMETFKKFKTEWDFMDCNNRNIEYYYKFAQFLRCQLRDKLDVELEIELFKFMDTNEKIDLKEFQQFLIKLKESLINKEMEDIDIGLNNEIVELTTKCIYGINKISEKK